MAVVQFSIFDHPEWQSFFKFGRESHEACLKISTDVLGTKITRGLAVPTSTAKSFVNEILFSRLQST